MPVPSTIEPGGKGSDNAVIASLQSAPPALANDRGAAHNPAMLRRLTRIQARLLLAAVALALAWSVSLGLGPSSAGPADAPHDYSDVQLYRDVAAAVAAGQDYYAAATSLHRLHGFPTVPFFTVRLPTLSWAAAAFGWTALQVVLGALLLALVLVWYGRLEREASKAELAGAVAALVLGGAMVTQPQLVPQHDQWVGLLLTLALALRTGPSWPWAVACAALALAIRELALAFVLLALAFALVERRWREAAAWIALITVFAAGMAAHAHLVDAQVRPGDLHSQGWNAMRGPAGTIRDVVEDSLLNALPLAAGAPIAILALFGWTGAPPRFAIFALLWFAGFGTAIALFARESNGYWAIELIPAWFIGFAFLPRAARDLAAALAPN